MKKKLTPSIFYYLYKKDRINHSRLSSLATPKRTYDALDWFRDASKMSTESLSKHLNTPDSITLAVGAQVILTKNVATDIGLVNGSRGVVIGFEKLNVAMEQQQWASNELYARSDPNELLPVVQFVSKIMPRIIGRVEFEVSENGGKTKIASRCAIPLKLAWVKQQKNVKFLDEIF